MDNWFIREEWMDHLAPESMCAQCLAIVRRGGKAMRASGFSDKLQKSRYAIAS
jgi:hypothetical protein